MKLAQLQLSQGLLDDASQSAKTGVEMSGGYSTHELQTFLAGLYLRRGHGAEALALMWKWFLSLPTFSRYVSLKRLARETGAWGRYRARLLDSLARMQDSKLRKCLHLDLAAILFAEGQHEKAAGLLKLSQRLHDAELESAAKAAQKVEPRAAFMLRPKLVESCLARGFSERTAKFLRPAADEARAAGPAGAERKAGPLRAEHPRKLSHAPKLQ